MTETPDHKPPASLLNAHCSHTQQHGPIFANVKRFTTLAVTRGLAYAAVRSWRDGRRGELPVVTLSTGSESFGMAFDMTPDDADEIATALRSAAKTAREVRALLEAGACK